MADYYRKTVNNTANDVKLKMQMAAFTLKLSENNDKIDDLLKADKDIKKDITDNSNNIKNMNKDTTNNFFTCSRLRCTFLSSPKLVYIGELYFSVILFSALPNLFT